MFPVTTPPWFMARRLIHIHPSRIRRPVITLRVWPSHLASGWQWVRPGVVGGATITTGTGETTIST